MFAKRCMVIGLSLILALGVVLATSAASPPTPTPTPKPRPLEQIIEGAKKEGTLSLLIRSNFTPGITEQLEKEIKKQFGVDLKINFTPVRDMPKVSAQAIMEYKAGAPPSYDLMELSASYLPEGVEAGIYETVDWKALFTENTNPDVLIERPLSAPSAFNDLLGLMYNPEKVPAGEVPKRFSDLADPKRKGKVGILRESSIWTKICFDLGKGNKEKGLSIIRAIIKNGAFAGPHVELFNRYLLGEIWMSLTNTTYYEAMKGKGMPAAWQSLDYIDVFEGALLLRKGAKHPNAAKLVAIYLVSPEGARYLEKTGVFSSIHYPGRNHELLLQAKRQGIALTFSARDKKVVDFMDSKEGKQWRKEITLILELGR